MRYQISEQPKILGKFTTGATVTITLYNLSDESSETLTSNVCNELGSTGVFYWSTSNITTQPSGFIEYCWVMTDGTTSQYGKIVLGGYVEYVSRRTSIRSGGGLEESDKKEIAKSIVTYKLNSNRTLAEELIAKSEFNFETDTVKTDIKIPEMKINLRDLKDELIIEFKNIISQLNDKKEIKAISDLINKLDKENKTSDSNLMVNLDKLLKLINDKTKESDINFGEIGKLIKAIKMPVLDISEAIKAVNELKKEFKDSEVLVNLKQLSTDLKTLDSVIAKKDVNGKVDTLKTLIDKTNDALTSINKTGKKHSEGLDLAKSNIKELENNFKVIEKMIDNLNKVDNIRVKSILIDNSRQFEALSNMLLKINKFITDKQQINEIY